MIATFLYILLDVNLGSEAEGGLAGANYVRRSITLNTGFGEKRIREGNIEELLVHEGAHVSLDGYHERVRLKWQQISNTVSNKH